MRCDGDKVTKMAKLHLCRLAHTRSMNKAKKTALEAATRAGYPGDMRTSAKNITRVSLTAALLLLGAFIWASAAQPKPAKDGKLYHVGLVWLKDPGNAEQRKKIIEAAHAFAKQIPEVESLSVGQTLPQTSSYTDASFDVCFVMQLKDKAAMDRYGAHPVHQKAAQEVFLPFSKKITFYDFISE
jgi:hypothetical protein